SPRGQGPQPPRAPGARAGAPASAGGKGRSPPRAPGARAGAPASAGGKGRSPSRDRRGQGAEPQPRGLRVSAAPVRPGWVGGGGAPFRACPGGRGGGAPDDKVN